MTPGKINETIKAREAEIQSVVSAFEKRKAEIEKVIAGWNQFGNECQLKVTHLQGCIAELNRQLPKPKEKKEKKQK